VTESAAHLRIIEETPAYWRVVFGELLATLIDTQDGAAR
jgi:hypothetical protein